MSIRQFKAVQAIGEFGSFAAAARDLGLTQSAISMQVLSLEKTLAVTLFDRRHRPPRLTRAGAIVLSRARRICDQYDDIFEALAEARSYVGVFRLGAIPSVLTGLLPRGLMRLRDLEPELGVNVSSDLSGALMRQVARGDLDAALIHKPDDIGADFAWRDVVRQRIVVIAPPGSSAESVDELLRRYPYIRFNRAAWVAPMIERRLGEYDARPNTRAEIQSVEAIHHLVQQGFGISILPDVSNGSADAAGASVRILDFGAPPLYRTVGLISRQDSAKRNARRLIGDVFVKAAGG